MTTFQKINAELKSVAIADNISILKKYFQVFPGGYGENDEFLGVKIPLQREICKRFYLSTDWQDLEQLILSKYHEHRMCAVFILINKYNKTKSVNEQNQIIQFYLHHINQINNWDLVDSSSYKLLGDYCRKINHFALIKDLATQSNFWHIRVAIVSTLDLIKHKNFDLAMDLCLQHAQHTHDMIQKAIGWVLKEIGNINTQVLIDFLNLNHKKFKIRALRIASEKLSPNVKQIYFEK